jgi:transposase
VYTETPNKKLVKHAELDEISSPVVMGTTTPSSSEKMDFAEVEDETRLRKIPSIKRAEVDSYVLSLKRQHNHSDETKIEKKERNRKVASFLYLFNRMI